MNWGQRQTLSVTPVAIISITNEDKADAMKARLKERFDTEVLTHYNFYRSSAFIQSAAATMEPW